MVLIFEVSDQIRQSSVDSFSAVFKIDRFDKAD